MLSDLLGVFVQVLVDLFDKFVIGGIFSFLTGALFGGNKDPLV